jgi:hypothetical protein
VLLALNNTSCPDNRSPELRPSNFLTEIDEICDEVCDTIESFYQTVTDVEITKCIRRGRLETASFPAIMRGNSLWA